MKGKGPFRFRPAPLPFILVAGILLIALAAVPILRFIRARADERRRSDFTTLLTEVDRKLLSGNPHDALADLDRAVVPRKDDFFHRSLVAGRLDWLMVIRRAFEASERTGGFSVLRRITRAAAGDLPGNEELWALAVYAAMKDGDYTEAGRLAADNLRSPAFHGIEAEALVRSRMSAVPAGKRAVSPDDGVEAFLRLIDTPGPEVFLEAAELTGDRRWAVNAALVTAQNGDMQKALSLYSSSYPAGHYSILGGLLAGDASDYETALRYLMPRNPADDPGTDSLLLSADAFMRLHRQADARKTYRTVVETSPGLSWIPYRNLFHLLQPEDPVEGVQFLETGVARFPDVSGLVLPLARAYYLSGRKTEGDTLLDGFISRFPHGIEARLLRLKLSSADTLSRSRFEAELWQLFYEQPAFEPSIHYLSWYLTGVRDSAGLKQVYASLPPAALEAGGVRFYRGVLLGLAGDLAGSAAEFEKSLHIAPSVHAAANLGLVLEALGKPVEAEDRYREALGISTATGTVEAYRMKASLTPKEQAAVLVSLAALAAGNGRVDEARVFTRIARETDPGNLEAHFLLRKLEH